MGVKSQAGGGGEGEGKRDEDEEMEGTTKRKRVEPKWVNQPLFHSLSGRNTLEKKKERKEKSFQKQRNKERRATRSENQLPADARTGLCLLKQ